GLVIRNRTAQDRERSQGAGVDGVDGRPVVEDTAAQAAAAVAVGPAGAADGPVAAERAARNDKGTPEEVRDPAPQPIAAVVAGASRPADRFVVRNEAVAGEGQAPLGGGLERAGSVGDPTAPAGAHEGAGRVGGAADGPVVADCHVARVQDRRTIR